MVAHAQKIAIESLPSVSWGIWTLQPRWYALTWLAIGRGFWVVIIASVPPLASITDNLSKDADHSATVPIVVHQLDDGVVGSVAGVPTVAPAGIRRALLVTEPVVDRAGTPDDILDTLAPGYICG
jgi:hypothetical protein